MSSHTTTGTNRPTATARRLRAIVLTAAAATLVATAAGAAQRVVLGDYFTNLY